jgi:starvation-inducible DNA-binding protein
MHEKYIPLVAKLSHILADSVTMKSIAQGYHWNVKGIEFSQLHKFFGKIYEDVDSAVDPAAESIRTLGFESPYLLQDFQELTCIKEGPVSECNAMELLTSLARVNSCVLACVKETFITADMLEEQGIADFLAQRISMHQKWQWQLESSLGIR